MLDLNQERGNILYRYLDRYMGIPIVYLLGFFTPKKKSSHGNYENEIKNILIIKIGTIGDSLLTFPIVKALKKQYKDISINVICGNGNEGIIKKMKKDGVINQYFKLDIAKIIKNPLNFYKFIKNINKKRYDLLIDFEPWARISALISGLIYVPKKIGFKKNKQYRHYVFTDLVVHNNKIHEIENYNNLIRRYVGEVSGYPDYHINENKIFWAKKYIIRNNIKKYIVFHPWTAGYKHELKQLDLKIYEDVGKYFISKGYSIIVTGGKSDYNKSISLVKKIGINAFSEAGKLSIEETASLLKLANCVLSVNTGIMHLAAAVKANLVSINGPTDIKRWGPLCDNVINISSKAFCSPCLDLGFEYKCKINDVSDGWCMTLITKNEIINAIDKQIELKSVNI